MVLAILRKRKNFCVVVLSIQLYSLDKCFNANKKKHQSYV